ncbi:hypothetical protein SAMN05421678_10214 [Actinopolymorpha cephalotaxi]|uniref:Immunity MXAN-0049 protein domain-containing protein n=1 Tax=Actinopolymorpha cephalotaxi TaxID=504797 RepID=A0A1I2LF04_9ACTN|nr:DUF1629 domain-containing protein [Actinopolymorpha cephalotaxi]NYH85016.1 hypothetical protein [Actinopolymorpha cephalotaxi]SFF75676.1 hypothetical protein SAMN05421678_10214 [Actinopolymorpha cephalotaxi]
MRVFELYPVGEYDHLAPVDDDDLERLADLEGARQGDAWTPIPVRILTTDVDTGEPLLRADFPWFASWALMLRDRAIDLAGPVLAPFGELLPLTCDDAKVVCFNAVDVLDAVDEERSGIVRFPSSGRIMTIEKYVFSPDLIPERAVFRVPQQTLSVFYTEPVVRDLRALDLTGLDFRLVWDSDAD